MISGSIIVSAQRFRFKADVTEEQKSHAIAAITAVSRLESVAFAVVGQDLGDPDEGFTHGYLVGIPDLDALEQYFRDPVHAAGDRVFFPLLEKVTGIGISDDTDPDLRDRVVALAHRPRIQRDPEYAECCSTLSPAVGTAARRSLTVGQPLALWRLSALSGRSNPVRPLRRALSSDPSALCP